MNSLPQLIDQRAITEPGLAFTLRLGEALHKYGVPAHRLEQAMAVVAARFGLRGCFYSTPTAILASFGPAEALRTCMIRVEPGDVDLGRLAALDELTTQVIQGRCDAEEAQARLDEILGRPPLYGNAATVAAFCIASGGAAYLLGGSWREVLMGLVIGTITGLLAALSGRVPPLARLLEGIGAFVATALATAGEHVLGPYSVQLAVIAGIIVLLPGLSLTIAFTELATRNLVSGTSRAMGALVTFMLMGFGVAMGSQVSRLLPPLPTSPPAGPLPGWFLVPALLFGVGAFSITFKARWKEAPTIVLGGSLAFFAAAGASSILGPQLGAFVGSFALCGAANLLARLRNKPSIILILPGLLLLVPGSIGFRSLDALLERNVLSGVETAFNMAMVAVAIVIGLLMANVVVPPRKVL